VYRAIFLGKFIINRPSLSLDETSGDKVVNYGLETRLEADTELSKNRLSTRFKSSLRTGYHADRSRNMGE
jgi:hypothetical protein